MTVASTVSIPPPSVTWLTTPASVMMTVTVTLRTSVTLTLASVSPSPPVLRMLNVMALMRSAMLTMTTASSAAETTVTPLMDAAQVKILSTSGPGQVNVR